MGRPRKPLERSEMLKKGDGVGTNHADTGGEIVEYQPTALSQVDLSKIPPIPAGLMHRGEKEWIQIWTAGQAWLHQSEDYHLVEIVARAYDEITVYRQEIGKNYIVKGYAGQKTANPLIKEIREAERTIIKCLSMLGFSPSDRAKLGLKALQTADKLSKLQQQNKEKR